MTTDSERIIREYGERQGTIRLTPGEREVLLLVLSIDMDAIGLDEESQLVVSGIVSKLKETSQ